MNKFMLMNYKGNYAMRVSTKREYEIFSKFLDDNGKTWRNGDSYLENIDWTNYREDTCFCFNEGIICGTFDARHEGYTVLEFCNFSRYSWSWEGVNR